MDKDTTRSPVLSGSGDAPPAGARRPNRVSQVFWLAFLVGSLAYAWYSFYVPPNDITWVDDVALAQEQASATGQPMILFFTGTWCVPCRVMKRQVWADDEVAGAVNGSFVPVMVDVDDSAAVEALQRYGIGATPTTIVTDSRGEVLQWHVGGLDKAGFLELLATSARPGDEDA